MSTAENTRCILVVDDEEPIRKIIVRIAGRFFQEKGLAVDVVQAGSFKEGLSVLREVADGARAKLFIVFSDYRLGDGMGPQMISQSLGGDPSRLGELATLVVGMSGMDAETARPAFEEVGVTTFYEKPVRSDAFRVFLDQALELEQGS
ncbi:MAG: hypothetical protein WCT46_05465 [Candidatus Gracilibacteria bacterium]|jgi:CheY-like chemotaxis protein